MSGDAGAGSPVIVHGAGGHAKVVADVARALGHVVAAFVEDTATRDGLPYHGASILAWDRFATESRAGAWPGAAVVLAVGDNAARQRAFDRIVALGRRVATLVHPSAVVSPSARLGTGTVVMPTAVINADATVGLGVILNTGAVAEHDTVIGDFAHLSPNATLGGGARVGARAHLGLGALVLPRIGVGDDARVGAGAVVRLGVAPGTTVVGVPARPLPPA